MTFGSFFNGGHRRALIILRTLMLDSQSTYVIFRLTVFLMEKLFLIFRSNRLNFFPVFKPCSSDRSRSPYPGSGTSFVSLT